MQPFNQGKRFVQLLLRRDDLRRLKINDGLPLALLVAAAGIWLLLRFETAIERQVLTSWLAAAATVAAFFLAYKLSHSDQRRREAERQARASELKFDRLYNSNMIGLWLTGMDGGIVQANDAFLAIVGYTREELDAGQVSWKAITAPEYEGLNADRLALLHGTGWCGPCEKEYIRQDGRRVKVMVGSAYLSDDPKTGILAYALDMSGTQRIQEQMLQIFMEAPANIVIRKGPDLKITFVNNAALVQSQLDRGNVEGVTTADYFKKAGTNFDIAILKQVYETGEPFKQKAYHVRHDRNGAPVDRWYDMVIEPTRDAKGHIDGVATYTFDVSDFVNANEALSASETRFRFIADAIPHKMWTCGPDGKATYYNQGWYDYTGTDSFEELKDQVWTLIHPDDLENTTRLWKAAVADGTDVESEQRLRRHDGEYFWHLSRVCVHKDDNGQVKMWVGTSTNIHAQKENEQRKDEFLSIASHELKTPLTSIKAFNQLMKRTKDEERLSGFIDKSAEHIYRLERLINDLLDVTKINAGKMAYTMEPFMFSQLLRDSIANMQYNATHDIVLDSAPDIEFTGDRFRLEQVLNNFLTNAAKYSPDGSRIVVNGRQEDNGIIVSVQDFGIGIAPENLDKLFDRYYRVDNTAMRFDGLGLGLFISSEILKRHQGSFWIESELGKGATFYFRLPLAAVAPPPVLQTKTDYRDNKITIHYLPEDGRMEVDWTGFQDLESVKHGCMLMLEYLTNNHCDRIVNDNTNVQGNWSDAVEWVGNDWFPMMEKAGLKYFAHLFSPSTFSQLSAKKSIDIMAGIITTQYFTDIEPAREWIDSRPR